MEYFDSLKRVFVSADDAVEQKYGDRWFIKCGQNGFNSPANNRMGYDSKEKALAAIRRYTAKGEAHRARVAAGLERY